MPRRTPRLLLLHDDPSLADSLACAARDGRFRLARVDDWGALKAAVERAPPWTLVLADPLRGSRGPAPAPGLAQAMRAAPLVTFLPAVRFESPGVYRVVDALRELGLVTHVALGLHDSPRALRQILERDAGQPCQAMLHRILGHRPEFEPGWSVLVAAARSLARGGTPADLPRLVGVPGVGVRSLCRDGGLPGPRRVIAWVRLLLAARLLDGGMPPAAAARAAGYPGEAKLRMASHRLLRVAVEPLVLAGAVDVARTAFLAGVVRRQERRRRGW